MANPSCNKRLAEPWFPNKHAAGTPCRKRLRTRSATSRTGGVMVSVSAELQHDLMSMAAKSRTNVSKAKLHVRIVFSFSAQVPSATLPACRVWLRKTSLAALSQPGSPPSSSKARCSALIRASSVAAARLRCLFERGEEVKAPMSSPLSDLCPPVRRLALACLRVVTLCGVPLNRRSQQFARVGTA